MAFQFYTLILKVFSVIVPFYQPMYKSFNPYFLIAILLLTSSFAQAQKHTITGVVTDKETHLPIIMSNVFLSESAQGTATDDKGNYEINNIACGKYHLCCNYLGYEAFDTLISVEPMPKVIKINILLTKTSLQLKEVNVMAREKKQPSTTSTIKLAAIENLQPSSMADVLQMLPGGLMSDSKLNTANQVSMRQAGNDINTAMGTAIVQDGVPVSNDYSMQSLYGTSSTDVSSDKSSVNKGVDLRQISTDHVDEVEIIRGIPSVKYGDLTSGAIIIKSKKGETPLNIRVKSDPLNKLLYVGKGINLPKDLGTLNFGIDYTNFVSDQRSPFDKYQRITANLNYEKVFHKTFRTTTQLAYTGTIDKKVNDPDIMNEEDKYKSDYNSLRMSNSGTWNVNKGLLNKIEYTVSANYANEVLERTKTITLNSPMGMTLNNTAGESEGFYLPSEYLGTYKVDGKPFNFYSQIITYLHPKIGETFNNVLIGGEFRADKNFGDGAVYDLTKPPFPNNSSSSRPRAPKDIPGMQKLTVFAEDNFSANIGDGKLAIIAGLRLTTPFNIADSSAMYHKLYMEPRLNVNYQIPSFKLFGSSFDMTVKGGFGDQVKFPTVMQLYPEMSYYDISEANYYASTEANRFIYLKTYVKDRTNNDLTPARNRKLELGVDLRYKDISLNLTAFHEVERNGFQTQNMYFPAVYTYYNNSSIADDFQGKPALSDFTTSETKYKFLPYSYTTNSAVVVKNGIEYQLSTRKIKAINTEIVVNGAWFHTTYDISQPRYEYPTIVSGDGNFYRYIGVYNAGDESKEREQLNTTIFFNTHFPKQRLLFSTSIQSVWYSSYQMIEYSGVPDYYIDVLDNKMYPFTDVQKQDATFKSLMEDFSDAYFLPEKTPISLEVNLKVTKEIGEKLKLSFFVNRLFDYNPRYYSRFGVASQKWVTPFMGAELQIKI